MSDKPLTEAIKEAESALYTARREFETAKCKLGKVIEHLHGLYREQDKKFDSIRGVRLL